MSDIVPAVLAHLAPAIAFVLIDRASRRGRAQVDPFTSGRHFRHSAIFRGGSIAATVGLPGFVTWMLFNVPIRDNGDLEALFGLYAGAIGLSAPLWWESSRFEVTVEAEGLDCNSPWRSRQFFGWGEVERFAYSPAARWFIIRTTDGRTFRVPDFIAGITEFLAICESRLPRATFVGIEDFSLRPGR